MSTVKDEAAVLYVSGSCRVQSRASSDWSLLSQNQGGLMPDAARYVPPEVKQGGWSVLRE